MYILVLPTTYLDKNKKSMREILQKKWFMIGIRIISRY